MNKVILFLWFGDEKPPYIQWTLENFRKMNPSWEIRYIEYSTEQITHYKEQNDIILSKSMNNLVDICNHKINSLSDKYRMNYLNEHKDEIIIYCDLDCFPIAPFDNFIFDENYVNDKEMPQWIAKLCDFTHRQWGPGILGSWGIEYKNLQIIKKDVWCLCNNHALTVEDFIQFHKGSVLDETLILHNSMFINEKFIDKYNQRQIDFQNMNIQLGDNFCLPKFTPIEHYYSKERYKINKNKEVNT